MPTNLKNKTSPLDAECLRLLGCNLHSFRLEKQIPIINAAKASKLSIDEIDTIERGDAPFLWENYLRLVKYYRLKLFLSLEENYVD